MYVIVYVYSVFLRPAFSWPAIAINQAETNQKPRKNQEKIKQAAGGF